MKDESGVSIEVSGTAEPPRPLRVLVPDLTGDPYNIDGVVLSTEPALPTARQRRRRHESQELPLIRK